MPLGRPPNPVPPPTSINPAVRIVDHGTDEYGAWVRVDDGTTHYLPGAALVDTFPRMFRGSPYDVGTHLLQVNISKGRLCELDEWVVRMRIARQDSGSVVSRSSVVREALDYYFRALANAHPRTWATPPPPSVDNWMVGALLDRAEALGIPIVRGKHPVKEDFDASPP